MSKKIGVLHHPDSHAPTDLYPAISELAEIVWIVVDGLDGGRIRRVLLERLGTVMEISSTDLDAAAEMLAQAGIDGVVAFLDLHLELAAELAHRLQLPSHSPEVAATVRNKFRQREALAAAGVPQPRYWHLPVSLDAPALRQAVANVAYPAVMKPVEGAASHGVWLVSSEAELAELYHPELEQIVEEYMPDTRDRDQRFASYVSVESTVSQGDVGHVAVSGRFPLADGFRENGIFMPAGLDDRTSERVLDLTTAAIRAIGIENACTHIEIKLTPTGPKIIEVNGRVGGGPPGVLQIVSDVSLFALAAQIALGQPVHFDHPVECDGIAFSWDVNVPLNARRVVEIRGTEVLSESAWVTSVVRRAEPGAVVDPSRTFGIVKVRGRIDNYDELAEMMELINTTIEIDYETAAADPLGPRA